MSIGGTYLVEINLNKIIGIWTVLFVFKAKLIRVLTIFGFKQLAMVLIYQTFYYFL